MEQARLIALKDFTHSVGTVMADSEFFASATFARSLVQEGYARFADQAVAVDGSLAGCRVVIIASGRSVTPDDIERVRQWRAADPAKRKVAVVCLTFRDVPWADFLYAADEHWWETYHGEVQQKFGGESWSQCDEVRRKLGSVRSIRALREPGLSRVRGVIHSGGNSGYQSIGLMYDMGCRDIVLLGFDMQRYADGKNHHHENYPKGFNKDSPYERWVGEFGALAYDLERFGAKVVNASRLTALQRFARQSLEAALAGEAVAPRVMPRKAHCLLRPAVPYRREAFVSGLSAIGCKVSLESPRSVDESTLLVIWNRYGGNHETASRVEKAGGAVVVAENGYLGFGGCNPKYYTGEPERRFFALALGGHNGYGRTPEPSAERFDQLKVELKPWRCGRRVVVCPNRSFGTPGTIMPDGWGEKTAAKLREMGAEVLLRPHPGNEPPRTPLADDLKDTLAVVIWSSSAGVQALVEGVPVVQLAPRWICERGSAKKLDASLPVPDGDRLAAMHRLASAQWTTTEIASGEAFKRLMEVR